MTDQPPIKVTINEKPQSIWQQLMDRLPTTSHVFFMTGTFGLVAGIFYQIGSNPKLLANASYMQVVMLVVGILVVIGSNLFSGTKAGSTIMTSQNDALVKQAVTTPPPDSATTITTKTVPDPTKGTGT